MTKQARMQEAPQNINAHPFAGRTPTRKPAYPSFFARYEWAMSHKLPAIERLVLVHIAYRAGTTRGCIASQGSIAEDLQISRRSVIRAMTNLSRQGLIKHGGTTHAMTTIWHLALDVDEPTALEERGCDTESHLDGGCDRESHPLVTQSHMPCDSESHPLVTESHTNPEGNLEGNPEGEPSASADEPSIQSKLSRRPPITDRKKAQALVQEFVTRHEAGAGFAPRWRRHRTDEAQVAHYMENPQDYADDLDFSTASTQSRIRKSYLG